MAQRKAFRRVGANGGGPALDGSCALIRFNPAATSLAVGRAAGSRASIRSISAVRSRGASGFAVASDTGSPCAIASIASSAVSAGNGCEPAASSNSTRPMEKISDAAVSFCPCACSGDMYRYVPAGKPGWLIVSASNLRANPKSRIFR